MYVMYVCMYVCMSCNVFICIYLGTTIGMYKMSCSTLCYVCTALMCVYTLSQPTPPILNFTLLSLVPIHLQDHDDSTKY